MPITPWASARPQLHNKTVVYNHKRPGKFALGGRTYDFRMKPAFPEKLVAGDLDRPFDDIHLEGLVDQSIGRHVVKRGVE